MRCSIFLAAFDFPATLMFVRNLTDQDCCSGRAVPPTKCQIFVAKGTVAKNREFGLNLPAIVVRHGTTTYHAVNVTVTGTVTFKQLSLSHSESGVTTPDGEQLRGPLIWAEADWPVEMVQAFDASQT